MVRLVRAHNLTDGSFSRSSDAPQALTAADAEPPDPARDTWAISSLPLNKKIP